METHLQLASRHHNPSRSQGRLLLILMGLVKIRAFDINLDEQAVTVSHAESLYIESALNELAKINDKMAGWLVKK